MKNNVIFDTDIWLIDMEKLAMLVDTSFNEEELRQACFDLEVDYDNIAGRTKITKIYELIAHHQRRERLGVFIDYCRKQRPTLAWQSVCSIPTGDDERPPYKGLQPYTEDDAQYFFGRAEKTAVLINRLNLSQTFIHYEDDNFLAIIGASGSGKSSLVRAGLVATLQGKRPLPPQVTLPPGCKKWPVHIITPTDDPLESLIASLAGPGAIHRLKETWYQDQRSLHRQATERLNDRHTERLLLVVDQFEELFTLCQDDGIRRAFIGNLIESVLAQPSSVVVVITLRADFYHYCAQYERLRELLAKRQEFIGGMTADELRQVIESPASTGKWELEAGLVERILDDVGREPGILPLLSHLLHETWRRRNGRRLTLWGYENAGGVQGAISNTADQIYNRLTPDQQQIARYIFLRLTAPGEGDLPNDTRRPVLLEELLAHPDPEQVQRVLNILVQGRLITMRTNAPQAATSPMPPDVPPEPLYQQRHVEIAHEALIRYWTQFQEWLDTHRRDLLIQRRLTADALDWQTHDQNSSYLYRGQQLETALAINDKTLLNTLEQSFLQASRAYAGRQRLLAGGIGVVLIALLVAFFFVINSQPAETLLSWQNISPDEDMVMSVVASTGHSLYASTENTGVWHSLDGQNWTPMSQGIPDVTVSSGTYKPAVTRLAVDSQDPARLLAFLTDFGVYERQAAGLPWQPFHDGLPPVSASSLDGALDLEVHGPLAVSLYFAAGQQQVYARQFSSPWQVVPPPVTEGLFQQVVHIGQTGDIVYLGTNKGLFRASVADEWQWERVLPIDSWVHEIEFAQPDSCGPLPPGDDCLYLAVSNPQESEFAIYRWSQTYGEALLTPVQTLPMGIVPALDEAISLYVLLNERREVVVILANGDLSTLSPFPDGSPAAALVWMNPGNKAELLVYRNALYRYQGVQEEIVENEK